MHRSPRLRSALLVIGVVSIVSVACDFSSGPPSTPIDGHPTTLAGTSWIVSSLGGVPLDLGNGPTIAFDGARARGSGGCNQFGGSYRYDPQTGELRFSEMGMTAMACAEPDRNAVETQFIQTLGQPSLVATIEPEGQLSLVGAAGRIDLDPASSANGG